jgi:very-short-patch-repair endonuclease
MKNKRIYIRKNPTQAENLLWQEIRNNKLGARFKRQYSIVYYVVDFYCASAKLAIELDGSVHKTKSNIEYDRFRTQYINSLGIKEIRFDNEIVINNMKLVLDKIKQSLPSPEIRRGIEGEVNL